MQKTNQQPKEQKQQKQQPKTFTCGVCFDDIEQREIVKAECGHFFHHECWEGYLSVRIKEGENILEIKCMHPDCDRQLTSEQIQKIVSEELFQKYSKFAETARLHMDPNVRWCPNPNCSQPIRGYEVDVPSVCLSATKQLLISTAAPILGYLNGETRSEFLGFYFLTSAVVFVVVGVTSDQRTILQRKSKCQDCGSELCFDCNQKWHPGSDCVKAGDAELEKWAKGKDVTDCPNCGVYIERIAGCNKMICTKCRIKFCWVCGEKIKDYSHFGAMRCQTFGGGAKQKAFRAENLYDLANMVIAITVALTATRLYQAHIHTTYTTYILPYLERIRGLKITYFRVMVYAALSILGSIAFGLYSSKREAHTFVVNCFQKRRNYALTKYAPNLKKKCQHAYYQLGRSLLPFVPILVLELVEWLLWLADSIADYLHFPKELALIFVFLAIAARHEIRKAMMIASYAIFVEFTPHVRSIAGWMNPLRWIVNIAIFCAKAYLKIVDIILSFILSFIWNNNDNETDTYPNMPWIPVVLAFNIAIIAIVLSIPDIDLRSIKQQHQTTTSKGESQTII